MVAVKEVNIVLAGVGGQGVVVAADILGVAAIKTGLNVRIRNVHGLAQREGSVYSHVRIGDGVFGPKIPPLKAHAIVGFELSEAARHLHLLNPEFGILLLNGRLIYPLAHYTGHVAYPSKEEILSKILASVRAEAVHLIDADALALRAGNPRAVNVVMLGALSATGILPFSPELLVEAVRERVPKFALEENEKAFWLGYEEVSGGGTREA
ncbi:MAG TPA: indolepyruvate ferredoxin oxidoreductase subunit beta [Candidatus Korarchaeota archaeon]|nr:indolepyruvate ferredoxin oxidoreductase subunit beta [Candidatus Korarchaeota archaeon]